MTDLGKIPIPIRPQREEIDFDAKDNDALDKAWATIANDMKATFLERVDPAESFSAEREWTMRDDNNQHHHGVVHLSESPLLLTLNWKANQGGKVQLIGHYRLNLPELLAHGFIRRELSSDPDKNVRLRFVRGSDDVIHIQVNSNSPRLPVGTINR